MHELSLCQNILKIVQEYVHPPHVDVTYIYLEIGVLAMVEKSALNFSFELLKKGTVAKRATLCFIDIPGRAFCDHCQKSVTITQYYDPCPYCQQFSLTITQGQELRIKSIEVA